MNDNLQFYIIVINICYIGFKLYFWKMKHYLIFNLDVAVSSPGREKKLFTPGPLSVSLSVREAALRDLGSRDVEFISTVKFLRSKLLQIAGKCWTWTLVYIIMCSQLAKKYFQGLTLIAIYMYFWAQWWN